MQKTIGLIISGLVMLAVILYCFNWVGISPDFRGIFSEGMDLLGNFFQQIKGIAR